MASINGRRKIGQELVIRVRSSGKGVKVMRFDGTAFADGIFTKHTYQYFYGEDAEQKAHDYAHRKCDQLREQRKCPVTVVELGEVMAEKLGESDE